METPRTDTSIERRDPIRILTIDDEEALRECMVDFLSDEGFDVREAENGRIGLDIIETWQPELVLCDLRMPEVDGLEVVKTVSRTKPDLPIIVVSGAGVIEDAIEAVRQGAWDYLIKPLYNMDVLVTAINKSLERADLLVKNREYQASLEQKTRELAREIEERKLAEKELIRSEKMAALGDLVAGVAHEINTPVGIGVTAVSHLQDATHAFIEVFNSGQLTKTALAEFLDDCRQACEMTMTNLERAAELVAGFKQVAVDQTSDDARQFDLEKYVNEILLSLHPKIKKTPHTVQVTCAKSIEIESYPGAFSQIVTNLVLNSLQHGLEEVPKGEIKIVIDTAPADSNAMEKTVLIHYSDNGKGMVAEEKEKIFNPFFTTKRGRGGTGLGMHLVYSLVTDKLKGKISCDTAPGKGIQFTLKLPVTLSNQ